MTENFFIPSGRISRLPFFFRGLILLLLLFGGIILLEVNEIYTFSNFFDRFENTLLGIFLLSLLILLSFQFVKRLQDISLSPYFVVIPILFFILQVVVGLIAFSILFVILSIIDGAKGENRFGQDPLNREKSTINLETSSEALKNYSKDIVNEKFKQFEKKIELQNSILNIKGIDWILLNDSEKEIIYIFRENGELIISENGNIEKQNFEFVNDNNSLIITIDNKSEIFDIIHLKDGLFFIRKFSSKNALKFVNKKEMKNFSKQELYTKYH